MTTYAVYKEKLWFLELELFPCMRVKDFNINVFDKSLLYYELISIIL